MPPKPAGLRPNPIAVQRWSTQTLILLSSSVGLTTYMLGFSSGYSSGKQRAAEDATLAGRPAPGSVAASSAGMAPPAQFIEAAAPGSASPIPPASARDQPRAPAPS
ncbi:hypothetical protein OC834_004640 [Tilletia horrida]|uniref:Uncharacterized protein n=1 Tax=Tilletia horrida TaxID=155126 RepID=A0AAN6G3E4_9BASI|nr:hypothetical protein OC842_007608 [Tilletia horrida]KAK0520084.1 hypothetical protein OC835_007319 [Tilletia horrida]KAK0526878.1 hypothetical protein OC834_004640 [Tilletia horrida]KAK0555488.1 hypothetical protein OC844_006050 [Tilletia horrida]